MKRGSVWLLVALGLALSGFFLAVMRPPGGQASTPGQDLPWQIGVGPDGTTLTVFGLTLGQSTVREAVAKLGRRYELGVFEERDGALSLEAYFRDAVVGGLNARMVLAARLPEEVLQALRVRAGIGKPTAGGSRRYAVAEADAAAGLGAVMTAITWAPMVKFDAELIHKRFGEPTERIVRADGTHWLYPALGLDLMLNEQGKVLLQYVPPTEFARQLRAPLTSHQEP
ncbi:MAG: hypothetical protein WAT67_00660 [Candidatus Contendobacter sp.]